MIDKQIIVSGGNFIYIWKCDRHPNERWDIHQSDNPFCIPCELLTLRTIVSKIDVDKLAKILFEETWETKWDEAIIKPPYEHERKYAEECRGDASALCKYLLGVID